MAVTGDHSRAVVLREGDEGGIFVSALTVSGKSLWLSWVGYDFTSLGHMIILVALR